MTVPHQRDKEVGMSPVKQVGMGPVKALGSREEDRRKGAVVKLSPGHRYSMQSDKQKPYHGRQNQIY